MSRTFQIDKNPYAMKRQMYRKDAITIEPGVTILVGCNGMGKTTLLNAIKRDLDDRDEVFYMSFDNLSEGGSNARGRYAFNHNLDFLATSFYSSEGENIILNLCDVSARVGKFVKNHSIDEIKELWLVFDAIDSGLSIDNVLDIKEHLFQTILTDERNKDRDVYILVSANGYEMVNGEKCFDVYNGKYVTFDSYDDYRKFILECSDRKKKRDKR